MPKAHASTPARPARALARNVPGVPSARPDSDEATQLLHVIARVDHEIDPLRRSLPPSSSLTSSASASARTSWFQLDGTRPHGVLLERHIGIHCSTHVKCLVSAALFT